MVTWWSPFVDGPPSYLGPTTSTKIHPSALMPDFTTHRTFGDSRSVQHLMLFLRRGFHYYLWSYSFAGTVLSLPISEGLDMGEHVGFRTSGPDCGPHRGVRTTTETRARSSAQRDCARGCHPAPVPA